MDNTSMLLLGMVKLQNPKTKQSQLVEVKGFDVLGFFLPFIRLISAGMWGKVALYCLSCCFIFPIPIWAWYMGFNFKRMRFEALLSQGWEIVGEERANPIGKAAA
jgi:hypothetical protein